jgi:hypothetical protein
MLDTKNSLIAESVLVNYQEYKLYYSDEKYKITIEHFGIFSQDLVNSLVEGNEQLMISQGETKQLRKRIFSILIEGLQNIRKHAEKDDLERQIAFIIIGKNEISFKVTFGNIIFQSECSDIISHIQYINTLSQQELKKFYIKELSENVFSKKGGAGLGFIIMRMKSNSELKFNVKKVNLDYALLSVEINLSKV